MPNYDVSVTMKMVDNVTKTLKAIQDKMDSVVNSAQAYNTTVERIARSFNDVNTSAINSATSIGRVADQLERVANAQSKINGGAIFPTITTNGVGTTRAVGSTSTLRGMKSDSGYGIDALRGSAADVDNLAKRLKELPKGMEYSFVGVSDRIVKIVNDLKMGYATGEQFVSTLRKMNIPDMGTGLSSAMTQAQSSFTRHYNQIKSMQDNLARNGVLGVDEMTSAYTSLASILKEAKNVSMQMNNVMASGKLSPEQVQELNAEYQNWINTVKAAVQQVTYLGDATDQALDSPQLKQAIQDFERLAQDNRALAESAKLAKAEISKLNSDLGITKGSVATLAKEYHKVDNLFQKVQTLTVNTKPIEDAMSRVSETTREAIREQDRFAATMRVMGNTVGLPDNVKTSLMALDAPLQNAYTSYARLKGALESAINTGSIEHYQLASQELATTFDYLVDVQNQIKTVMSQVGASGGDVTALKNAYDTLDSKIQELILNKRELDAALKTTFTDGPSTLAFDNLQEAMKSLNLPMDEMSRKVKTIISDFSRMPASAQSIATVRNSLNGLLDKITDTNTAQIGLVQSLRQSGTPNVQGAVLALDTLENSMNDAILKAMSLKDELNRFGTPNVAAVKNALKDVKGLMDSTKNTVGKLTKEMDHFPDAAADIQIVEREFVELKLAIENAINSENRLHNSVRSASTAMSSAAASTDRFNQELRETSTNSNTAKTGIDTLVASVKNLAGAYLGLQGAQAVLNTSDKLILTEGKFSNLTNDVEGLMDDIYQMSQDTRTAYLDNATQMAKMWQLTGGTEGIFETQDKLLQFNEVLNKSFTLGGSGTREINASLYQLTQALSSGRLQGDELRSLAENAPYLINAVTTSLENMYNEGKDQSEWIDLTYKDLKELGAEGALTSELIVAAVLNSTDEIRKAYENLTPTFEQTFQTLKNQATKIAEPVLKKLNEIINSEAFEKTAQAIMKILAVVVSALGPVVDFILWIGEVVADNWGIVEPIIWGIVGALAAYGTYLVIIKTMTIAVTIASKALAAVQTIFKVLTMMAILYRVAVGKATWAQAKMSASVLFGAQADAIKAKTGLGVATAEWEKAKAMWGSTAAAWNNAVATGASATAAGVATGATTGLTGSVWGFVTAEYAALLPILLVIAAIAAVILIIYLAVKAWNHYKNDTLTVLGAVAAGVAWLGGWIANVFIGIYNIGILSLKYIAAGIVALGAVAHNIVMGIANIFIKAAGVVTGAFLAAWAAIQNTGIGLWNGLVECAEGICNAFIYMKNVLNNIFVTLFGWIIDGINGILGGLNKLIDGYNAVAGALGGNGLDHFGTIETEMKIVDTSEGFVDFSGYKGEYKDISAEWERGLHMFDGYLQEYDSVGDAFNNALDGLSGMDSWMVDYVDPNDWANAGRKWGDNATDSIGDWWDGLMGNMDYSEYMKDAEKQMADAEKALEALKNAEEDSLDKSKAGDNYKNSVPNYSGSNLGGGGLSPEDEANLAGVKDNTDALVDEVSLTNKELELLRELAERRAINRFTTAQISITNNMTNNIDSEMDMDGVVNYLTEELNKALVAGSEAANHY